MYGILIILMHKTLCSDFISLQHFSVPPGHLGSIFAIVLTWKRRVLDEEWACVVNKTYRIGIWTFIASSGRRYMGHMSVILSHLSLLWPQLHDTQTSSLKYYSLYRLCQVCKFKDPILCTLLETSFDMVNFYDMKWNIILWWCVKCDYFCNDICICSEGTSRQMQYAHLMFVGPCIIIWFK
jgi:hypothetical protein